MCWRQSLKQGMNMAYTWSSDLETGNTKIDHQHEQLFAAVNALWDAYRSGKGRQEVENTMEFLLAYISKHFADEEALQEKYGYPEYLAHKRLHTEFKSIAHRLVTELSQDGPTDKVIGDIYATVGEWLVTHIQGDDFQMAAYVRNKEDEAQKRT